jgi:hypothetical protein
VIGDVAQSGRSLMCRGTDLGTPRSFQLGSGILFREHRTDLSMMQVSLNRVERSLLDPA